jgi:hypothetical protein
MHIKRIVFFPKIVDPRSKIQSRMDIFLSVAFSLTKFKKVQLYCFTPLPHPPDCIYVCDELDPTETREVCNFPLKLMKYFLSFFQGVFKWTVSPEVSAPTYCDVVVSYLTDGLTRWDGQVRVFRFKC